MKALAGESGVSVNEFISSIVRYVSARKELAEEWKHDKDKALIWDLPRIAKKVTASKKKFLSKEDLEVYTV